MIKTFVATGMFVFILLSGNVKLTSCQTVHDVNNKQYTQYLVLQAVDNV